MGERNTDERYPSRLSKETEGHRPGSWMFWEQPREKRDPRPWTVSSVLDSFCDEESGYWGRLNDVAVS